MLSSLEGFCFQEDERSSLSKELTKRKRAGSEKPKGKPKVNLDAKRESRGTFHPIKGT